MLLAGKPEWLSTQCPMPWWGGLPPYGSFWEISSAISTTGMGREADLIGSML